MTISVSKKVPAQLMLISSPNSGTDWLSRTILATNPKLKYYREFFNPACNNKHRKHLELEFGSEHKHGNIARCNINLCEDIYNRTWLREQYNFTKENYVAFKMPFFKKHFECIGLTRCVENSLPPSRREVYYWYRAIFHSMSINKETLPDRTREIIERAEALELGPTQRAIASYVIYNDVLTSVCAEQKIPLLRWEKLMKKEDEVLEELSSCEAFADRFGLDLEVWCRKIMESRSPSKKKFNRLKFSPTILAKKIF